MLTCANSDAKNLLFNLVEKFVNIKVFLKKKLCRKICL